MSEMAVTLSGALNTLQAHEENLHRRGVRHAAVFGSVARDAILRDAVNAF
jgi:predicted nucleotidyltransferase